ncbi:MAG: hypothetical protein AB8D78_09485 [Akkermansiaceae bacterium]
MEEINLRYILVRAVSVILLIVAVLYVVGFVKKKKRQDGIVTELRQISSESAYFSQFSAEDAKKSLIRAIGLVAEAKNSGLDPEDAIQRSLGIQKKYFQMDDDQEGPNVRQDIVIRSLKSNYENFLKFGYEADFHTLKGMEEGALPPVRRGTRAGKKPEIDYVIDPALSPGLEKVIANLQIQPTKSDKSEMTDIEIALAKNLVTKLARADVIEKIAEKRILEELARQASGLEEEEPEE